MIAPKPDTVLRRCVVELDKLCDTYSDIPSAYVRHFVDAMRGELEHIPEPATETPIERRPVREIAREFAVKWNWEHVTWGQQDWIDGRGEQIDDDTAKLAATVGALLYAQNETADD